MSSSPRLVCLAILAVGSVSFCNADDDFADLYRRLPESANTIVAIDVKTIRVQSGKSIGADAAGYEIIGGAPVSPAVDQILYATHMDPDAIHTRRTSGVIRLNRKFTLADIAERTDGEILDLDGKNIVHSRRRGYLFDMGDKTLGMAHQITRQELVRWMQFTQSNQKASISKYLAEVLARKDAPIVGAIDLANMFDPTKVENGCCSSRHWAKAVLKKSMPMFG